MTTQELPPTTVGARSHASRRRLLIGSAAVATSVIGGEVLTSGAALGAPSYTVVTISEFGRRVAENGNGGLDHGWGNMMLVAGGGVKGGKYYGTWPWLSKDKLIDGDLAVTTDYRNVLGEIVSTRFPERSATKVFPGLTYRPLGIMT